MVTIKKGIRLCIVAIAIVFTLAAFMPSVSAAELHVGTGETYNTIQSAINGAGYGETIVVHDGDYKENLIVNKSNIVIRSDNGSSVTFITSNQTDTHVVNITDQTNVTLDNFTIRDAYGANKDVAGIYMYNATKCNISNNTVTNISTTGSYGACGIKLDEGSSNNTFSASITIYNITAFEEACGIELEDGSSNNTFSASITIYNIITSEEACGIELDESSYNTFSASITIYNIITSGEAACGIELDGSSYNTFSASITIYNINASSGEAYGIELEGSDDNEFYDCTISDLTSGFEITTYGWYMEGSDENIVSGGKIFKGAGPTINYGVYMDDCTLNSIEDSEIFDCHTGIEIRESRSNHTILRTWIHDNECGIKLANTRDNEILDNTIEDNEEGISVEESSYNTIERNMIENNKGMRDTGVSVDANSTENQIHGNCFIDNVPQAQDDFVGASNYWDGNYWSPSPGGPGDYSIPGAAGSRDSNPLGYCPLCAAVEAPAVTPLGITALVGLLAVIATSTIVMKKRKEEK